MTRFFCAAALAVALAAPSARAQDAAAEKEAVAAADAWLKVVDSGRYGESWDGAARLFRAAVRKDDWARSLAGVRSPLGKVVSRKVSSRTFTRTLPGAPDGKYVVIEYATWFENKRTAIETVTPMLDEDGRWHVSGYFIR
jgi:hypothetical protein